MRRQSGALSIVATCPRVPAVVAAGLAAMVAIGAPAVHAQSATSGTKSNHNTYGSPLDTLMSSHLWTDVAPVQEFVKESRPDPKSLKYEPLTGIDPERPKPRDAANVLALQAELERDRLGNNRKAPAAARASKAPGVSRHAKVEPRADARAKTDAKTAD